MKTVTMKTEPMKLWQMKPSHRVLLVISLIEAGLAITWWLLLDALRTGTLRPSVSAAEATGVISTTLGGAMGALGGLALVIFFVLRRKGR